MINIKQQIYHLEHGEGVDQLGVEGETGQHVIDRDVCVGKSFRDGGSCEEDVGWVHEVAGLHRDVLEPCWNEDT